MSDAYDRQIEGRIDRLEDSILAERKFVVDEFEKDRARLTKLELWRNTMLNFLGGALFAAGYFAKPVADVIKKTLPTLG